MNWTDNVVMRALGRLCDFMLLNILWVVCSIPLVTIGASTTALYTVMLKVVKNEEGYIVKGFLGAFKENFKKSTLIWLILAVLGIIIGIDSRVAAGMSSTMRTVFQSIFIIFSIVWLCVVIYVFPLTARYENSIRNTFKNALILSVAKLPYTAYARDNGGACDSDISEYKYPDDRDCALDRDRGVTGHMAEFLSSAQGL